MNAYGNGIKPNILIIVTKCLLTPRCYEQLYQWLKMPYSITKAEDENKIEESIEIKTLVKEDPNHE